jgi:DNA-binding PadR family transcriptional regulator
MFGHKRHFSDRADPNDPTQGDGCHNRMLWAMVGRGHRGGGGPGGHEGGGHGGPFGFGRGGNPFRRMPWDFQTGARARRGDIRAAILALVAEQPRNGYQIMQELEQRSNGMWRPSSGSVYPTFQQLEDEGLVSVMSSGSGASGRTYQLTERGQTYVKDHPDEVSAPWESMGDDIHEQMGEFRDLIMELGSAVRQVIVSGTTVQAAAAKKILKDARKALYQLLAEGEKED